jgi:L-ribulokinase
VKSHACGGIAARDPFLMQIYADVLRPRFASARARQPPRWGRRFTVPWAAGPERGGFADIGSAVQRGPREAGTVYEPDRAREAAYTRLFACYSQLHDWFGRGGHDIMKQLKALRLETSLP